MRSPSMTTLSILTILAFGGTPASAITNGEPDGGRHPSVGIIAYGTPAGSFINPLCSGTLVAPDVFLTAAHCVARLETLTAQGFLIRAWVTFDEFYPPDRNPGPSNWIPVMEWHSHPDSSPPDCVVCHHDLGILILDLAHKPPGVQMPPPLALPPLGLLDDLMLRNDLHGQRFPVVGYGLGRSFPPPGPTTFTSVFDLSRKVATSEFLSLAPEFLYLSQNPNTGDGGTCSGDSGGPNLLGDTDIVAGVTSGGDIPCRAMGSATRTDTEDAREFLGQFMSLP